MRSTIIALLSTAGLVGLLYGLGACSSNGSTTATCTSNQMPAALPLACAACVADRCCASASRCNATAACATLTDCAFLCDSSDSACLDQCANRYSAAVDAYNAVADCAASECPSACTPGSGSTTGGTAGGSPVGSGGSNGGAAGSATTGGSGGGAGGVAESCPAKQASCAACLQSECPDGYATCVADTTCQSDLAALRECACTAQKANNAFNVQLCEDDFTRTDRKPFVQCMRQLCGTDCGLP
jgi:hypothetical protein